MKNIHCYFCPWSVWYVVWYNAFLFLFVSAFETDFTSVHYIRDVTINFRPVNDFSRAIDGFDYSKVTGMK